MTGPEHFKSAEDAIDNGMRAESREMQEFFLGAAQVHATLALAAATEAQSEAVCKAWEAYGDASLKDLNSIPKSR